MTNGLKLYLKSQEDTGLSRIDLIFAYYFQHDQRFRDACERGM